MTGNSVADVQEWGLPAANPHSEGHRKIDTSQWVKVPDISHTENTWQTDCQAYVGSLARAAVLWEERGICT